MRRYILSLIVIAFLTLALVPAAQAIAPGPLGSTLSGSITSGCYLYSTSGTYYHYGSATFTAPTTGSYTFTDTGSLNIFMVLISGGSFTYDVALTTQGMIGQNATTFTASLTAGQTYTMVTDVSADAYIGYDSCNAGTVPAGTWTITVTAPAAPPAAAAPSVQLPGPDMIAIPEDAAMGTFLIDTPLYYAPDPIAVSDYSMKAGQSLWVFGMSTDGAFYQVVLAGQKLWVPVDVLGTTASGFWHNEGLPTTVVN